MSPYERRRRLLSLLAVFGVLFIVGLGLAILGAWQAVSSAQASLTQARTDVDTLVGVRTQLLSHHGRLEAARELASVKTLSQQASHELHSSLGLDVLGFLPYLHTQRAGAIALADDVAQTAQNGTALLNAVDALVSHSHGTSVSLHDLTVLHDRLDGAVTTQQSMNRPSGGLLPPLAAGRQKFDRMDKKVTSLLNQGRQLVDYALPFLGVNGPRTYLLAMENNAEMRDQGAVLSYAVMTADNGTYSVDDAHPIGTIALSHPAAVPLAPGTQSVFSGYDPTFLWQSTNATADFGWSGADMQTMFEQATGVKVDGVIGVDVLMLQRLLRITGPVGVPGLPIAVSAQNVVPLLLHDLYIGEQPGADTTRNDELSAVFKATVDRMKAGDVDLAQLAETLAKGVATRDLVAWDSVPSYETTVTKFHGSGAIDAVDPTRTFHVAVENGTATKLDYYVHVSVSMNVLVTAGNNAVVNTTVTISNRAPRGQRPSYQLGPDGVSSTVPGQYIGHVYLWSPRGSQVEGAIPESGLMLLEHDVSVLPQEQATVQYQTVIPHAVRSGQLQLEFMPQPRLFPERLTVGLSAPSWLVDTKATITTTLAKQQKLSWGVVRP
jgi:hypothetical protein